MTLQVTIATGKNKASIEVPLVADYADELDEIFTLKLDRFTSAIAANTSATGTILDDDAKYLEVKPG
ncbi:MAG: hypothetical protein EOP06_18340, partial [Proteobacteria bacterium]